MYTRTQNWQGMNWIRPAKRLAIYIRDDFRCWYCDRNMRELEKGGRIRISLDHIIPHAAGGTNDAWNLITCCSECNSRRQDQPVETFAGEERAKAIKAQALLPLAIELARQIIEQRKAAKQEVTNG